MNKTKIEWTDATWNPVRGCSRVSEGCRNCYAEKVAYRFSGPRQPYEGLATKVNGHAGWTGEVRFVEEHLLDPLRWGPVVTGCLTGRDLPHAKSGHCANCKERPRRIFVNSMSDLFHPNVPDEWIDRIFAVMALCPQHDFQVLTKRPERMLEYFAGLCCGRISFHTATIIARLWHKSPVMPRGFCWSNDGSRILASGGVGDYWPLPNVWLGVSVENQAAADERIPLLLQTPAAVRFISAEPLLGPLWLRVREVDPDPSMQGLGWTSDALLETDIWCSDDGISSDGPSHPRIDWVIVGGESGSGARPMHPDWARSLRDQCQAAGVPFFFKQWGEWAKYIDRDAEDSDWRQPYDRLYKSKSFCFLNLAGGCGFHGERLHVMQRVGKHAAGAMLDGREWREFPEVRP